VSSSLIPPTPIKNALQFIFVGFDTVSSLVNFAACCIFNGSPSEYLGRISKQVEKNFDEIRAILNTTVLAKWNILKSLFQVSYPNSLNSSTNNYSIINIDI